ncbi:MAG: hypothetical protein ACRDBH_10470 [Bosea sp. (in: a-proteobacteria)]
MIRINLGPGLNGKMRSMPRWAFYLIAAGVAALGITLAILAAGLALLLMPFALAAGAYASWRLRKQMRNLREQGFGKPPGPDGSYSDQPRARIDVIEGDFEVLDGKPPKQPPGDKRPR